MSSSWELISGKIAPRARLLSESELQIAVAEERGWAKEFFLSSGVRDQPLGKMRVLGYFSAFAAATRSPSAAHNLPVLGEHAGQFASSLSVRARTSAMPWTTVRATFSAASPV